jgi:hypothetical protein
MNHDTTQRQKEKKNNQSKTVEKKEQGWAFSPVLSK